MGSLQETCSIFNCPWGPRISKLLRYILREYLGILWWIHCMFISKHRKLGCCTKGNCSYVGNCFFIFTAWHTLWLAQMLLCKWVWELLSFSYIVGGVICSLLQKTSRLFQACWVHRMAEPWETWRLKLLGGVSLWEYAFTIAEIMLPEPLNLVKYTINVNTGAPSE